MKMRYLDTLDSIKTAFPIDANEPDSWLRPEKEVDREHNIALAHANIMLCLLHGETISLSNNQIIDSTAWFQATEWLCKLKTGFSPVIASFYPDRLKRSGTEYLRWLAIDTFQKTGTNNQQSFYLSAWKGLDTRQREIIVENLDTKNLPFYRMLDGTGIDLQIRDELNRHAAVLTLFDEYLTKHETNFRTWQDVKGGEDQIWSGLKESVEISELEDIEKRRFFGLLKQIEGKVASKKGGTENRSNFYQAITQADADHVTRSKVRQTYDVYYNHKIATSVSNELVISSFRDDEIIPATKDLIELSERADKVYEQGGRMSNICMRTYFPDQFIEGSTIKFSNLTGFIESPEFLATVTTLHQALDQLDNKAVDFGEQKKEIYNRHHEVLAEQLGIKNPQLADDTEQMFKFNLRSELLPPVLIAIATYLAHPLGPSGQAVVAGVTDLLTRGIGVNRDEQLNTERTKVAIQIVRDKLTKSVRDNSVMKST